MKILGITLIIILSLIAIFNAYKLVIAILEKIDNKKNNKERSDN